MAVAEMPNPTDKTDAPKRRGRKPKDPNKEPTPAPTRPYDISVAIEGNLDQIVDRLKELVKPDEKAKVRLHVGTSIGNTPRVAITQLAEHVDLDGDYVVTAAKATTEFPNVKVVNKPALKFG
jgi:hypothetical protein